MYFLFIFIVVYNNLLERSAAKPVDYMLARLFRNPEVNRGRTANEEEKEDAEFPGNRRALAGRRPNQTCSGLHKMDPVIIRKRLSEIITPSSNRDEHLTGTHY